MAITEQQIRDACDMVHAAGATPTLAMIRKAIGGSYTTISPVLAAWKAEQAAKAVPSREPAPQAVVDKLGEFGGEVWRLAVELANARLSAEREALGKLRQELEDAQQEAVTLADQLAGELEQAQRRVAELTDHISQLRDEKDVLHNEIVAAKEAAARLSASAEELRSSLKYAQEIAERERAMREQSQRLADQRQKELTDEVKRARDEAAQWREQINLALAKLGEFYGPQKSKL